MILKNMFLFSPSIPKCTKQRKQKLKEVRSICHMTAEQWRRSGLASTFSFTSTSTQTSSSKENNKELAPLWIGLQVRFWRWQVRCQSLEPAWEQKRPENPTRWWMNRVPERDCRKRFGKKWIQTSSDWSISHKRPRVSTTSSASFANELITRLHLLFSVVTMKLCRYLCCYHKIIYYHNENNSCSP